jgi:hypothetical protein
LFLLPEVQTTLRLRLFYIVKCHKTIAKVYFTIKTQCFLNSGSHRHLMVWLLQLMVAPMWKLEQYVCHFTNNIYVQIVSVYLFTNYVCFYVCVHMYVSNFVCLIVCENFSVRNFVCLIKWVICIRVLCVYFCD